MRHRHSVTENPGQLVGVAALAATIGAAVAMLFTPRTGTQARRGIKRRAEHLKEATHDKFDITDDTADDVSEQVQTAATKAKDAAADAKSKVDSKAAAVKRDVKNAVDKNTK